MLQGNALWEKILYFFYDTEYNSRPFLVLAKVIGANLYLMWRKLRKPLSTLDMWCFFSRIIEFCLGIMKLNK